MNIFCKKSSVLFFTCLFLLKAVAQVDTLSVGTKKSVDAKVENTEFKTEKDTIKSVTTTQNTILLDSTSIQNQQKLDGTVIKESLPNPKADLSSLSVQQDATTGFKDDPKLSELDDYWRKELYDNSLFDSIYSVVKNTDYTKIEYVPNLPTEVLKDRLSDLNARTPFNVEYNPGLESVIKNYLKNRHQSMTRLMALSDYYFPLFEQVLDKYDLPLEIKYLAIVESALKPRARSRVGATGLWQFMYGTGKEHGLEINSYIDERMDPIKATEASAKYLSKLYKIFGDWDLALASYNSGPGNVTKAIRRSGGYSNYWNIRNYLPWETAGYVPAFLATMYIFEYAHEHDFKPKRVENAYFTTDTVKVKGNISFDQIAKVTDVKVEELQFLNPQYKLDVVPFVKNKDYRLRLPSEAIGNFVMNEDVIYAKAKEEFNKKEKPLPQVFEEKSKVRYRIRNGDVLGSIADKFGVRVSQIKAWNGLRSNNIRAGKYLTIYPRQRNASAKPKTKPKPIPEGVRTYTVKSGDSLWSIAQRIPGVSVTNLKNWNNISTSKLKPGMILKLEN